MTETSLMKIKGLESFSISYPTKTRLPRLPFKKIKEAMLGKTYELSLVCADDRLSMKLNNKYRKKKQPADVLSFTVNNKTGEIFINPTQAIRNATSFTASPKKYIGFLFIHGILHLKGWRHNSKMIEEERKWKKRFKLI